MMKVKQFLPVLLAAMMVFSLCACGGGETTSDGNGDTFSTSTATTTTATTTTEATTTTTTTAKPTTTTKKPTTTTATVTTTTKKPTTDVTNAITTISDTATTTTEATTTTTTTVKPTTTTKKPTTTTTKKTTTTTTTAATTTTTTENPTKTTATVTTTTKKPTTTLTTATTTIPDEELLQCIRFGCFSDKSEGLYDGDYFVGENYQFVYDVVLGTVENAKYDISSIKVINATVDDQKSCIVTQTNNTDKIKNLYLMYADENPEEMQLCGSPKVVSRIKSPLLPYNLETDGSVKLTIEIQCTLKDGTVKNIKLNQQQDAGEGGPLADRDLDDSYYSDN